MLEREDIDRLKEIFVTRQECQDSNEEINKKLANDSTELAVIKKSLDTIHNLGIQDHAGGCDRGHRRGDHGDDF